MKYKVLITGKNTTVIDDFFIQMDDSFEVVSTSSRFGDIMRHLKYFNPDIFVYCLNNEARESISQMVNIKSSLLQSRIPVVVIGMKDECNEFDRIAVNVANMTLMKPFTAVSIQESIMKYMDDRRISMEIREAEKEREEQIRNEMKKRELSKEALEESFQALAAELGSAGMPNVSPEEKSATEAAGAPEVSVPAAEDAEQEKTAEAQRQHILVVDDDPLMLKMLKEHLHDEYDVATAVSGKIALKFLERKKTNLILLDYEMPGETGPEVLEKLRANAATKDIPVIFLTGVSDRDKIQEALVLRPQSYLLKPIDREKLLDAIIKVIG